MIGIKYINEIKEKAHEIFYEFYRKNNSIIDEDTMCDEVNNYILLICLAYDRFQQNNKENFNNFIKELHDIEIQIIQDNEEEYGRN